MIQKGLQKNNGSRDVTLADKNAALDSEDPPRGPSFLWRYLGRTPKSLVHDDVCVRLVFEPHLDVKMGSGH